MVVPFHRRLGSVVALLAFVGSLLALAGHDHEHMHDKGLGSSVCVLCNVPGGEDADGTLEPTRRLGLGSPWRGGFELAPKNVFCRDENSSFCRGPPPSVWF